MKLSLCSFLSLAVAVFSAGCHHRATSRPHVSSASPTTTTPSAVPDKLTDYLFGWGEVPAAVAKPRGGTSRGAPVTLAAARELPLSEIKAAADSFARDRAAILALAGDYKVSFHFMETLGLSADHAAKPPYHSWATEHIRVIEDNGKFISLQHTLVMFMKAEDGAISGPMVMKHWRQDWTYEDTDLHTYQGDRTWARHRLTAAEATGTWSQAVFQVDDSPRYEAFGRWEHRGNLSQWTGSRELRPLPRREYTARKNYNVMEGTHRIILTSTGWLHEQQNRKRVAGESGGEPHYLAEELGLDRYELITEPSLAAAGSVFQKTGAYWAEVRKVWADLLARHDRLIIRAEIGGKRLFEEHFAHVEKLESGEPFDAVKAVEHARSTIERFIEIPPKS